MLIITFRAIIGTTKGREITTMKMNLGNLIETGKPRFPKGQIVKSNGTYLVLLLNWNLEANKAEGWFAAADGSLKYCRDYLRSMIAEG